MTLRSIQKYNFIKNVCIDSSLKSSTPYNMVYYCRDVNTIWRDCDTVKCEAGRGAACGAAGHR